MYCNNCGTKLENDVKFCPMCGTEVINNIKSKKKINPLVIAGIAGVCLALVVVILFVTRKPTINLNDYLTVEVSGYDTRGTVSYDFDDEALKEDYGDIIEKKMDKETLSKFGMNKYAKFIGVQGLIMNCIDGSFDKRSELSNGDTVTFSWECDDEVAQETFGVKLKYSDVEVEIEDLEVLDIVNPFEDVKVVFTGAEPNIEAEIVYENENAENDMFSLIVVPSKMLSNGDKVVLRLENNYEEEYYTRKYGIFLTETSKEYIVENMPKYITEDRDLKAENVQNLLTEAKTMLKQESDAYVYMYNKNYWYTSSSTNRLYMLFQVKKQDGMLDYYKIVTFDNLMVSGDGEISYEKSDVTTSYDYTTYLEKEKHGAGFSKYKENVGNIPSEIEYLDVPVLDVNVNEEKMFPVLDTLASTCYWNSYDSNDAEFFWWALGNLISYYPNLGEYNPENYRIIVKRPMLEVYATGLFEDYEDLLAIPEFCYAAEKISDEQYEFIASDRETEYSRMVSWMENSDGTVSVIVELVDEWENEVYATYQFTLVENPHTVNGVDQVYPYSVRAVEKLN